jgi:hypothetical protein
MKKSRFTESQMVEALKEDETAVAVARSARGSAGQLLRREVGIRGRRDELYFSYPAINS